MIRRAAHKIIGRVYRRLTRPLRLRVVEWRMHRSATELVRLHGLRQYLTILERNEASEQVCLAVRRQQIEREL